jgi:hypothetical protein
MECRSAVWSVWLLLLCATPAYAGNSAAPADISVSEAWIRWLPGNLPAGGYLILRNDGARACTLTSVSSPDYAHASLHRTGLQGAVSSMQPVQQIAVPAHQTLRFAPGGYHIMLEQAQRPIRPGDRVDIVLHFADGAALPASFEVRPPDAGGPS